MSYDRTIEPREITQGERIAWTRSFSDYPASEWTLVYRFRGLLGTGTGVDITATADGDDYDTVITAAESAAFGVTKYGWQAWLTEIATPSNKVRIADGLTDVLRGFATDSTAALDARTPAKIMLDTIDAALLAFATTDVIEYEISTPGGTRKVKRSDKMNLTSERKHWATIVSQEVWRARARRGDPVGNRFKVRMYED